MKNYEKPVISVTEFGVEDVITTSNIEGYYNPNNLKLTTLFENTSNSITY